MLAVHSLSLEARFFAHAFRICVAKEAILVVDFGLGTCTGAVGAVGRPTAPVPTTVDCEQSERRVAGGACFSKDTRSVGVAGIGGGSNMAVCRRARARHRRRK